MLIYLPNVSLSHLLLTRCCTYSLLLTQSDQLNLYFLYAIFLISTSRKFTHCSQQGTNGLQYA
ncbi:predicted protein [Pyrenophora tritici-repentis Pt-1C-BFP]|uniref:Uncharacterized protein n=1 Tax=Pyrenophora tritici-repentis (strain Pt-1C-BFP) TaxID=426418 RepID=B2W8J0_PYRTR|nr:uncharacterized protein PTRG_06298 [Pyrenophora tritici-repentis Pt-1C-BFP]EDU49218.1 predicted protein [Pyrenophora tritici-repentis Pt-1C-BFP]